MRIVGKIQDHLKWSKRRYLSVILGVLTLGYVGSAVYHTVKPLPEGLAQASELRYSNVKFLADQTYLDAQGIQQQDHHIFDQMLKMVKDAKTTIVLDMFLFNSEIGQSKQVQRPLATQFVEALIQKKKENPNIAITVLVDPINSVYGGIVPEQYIQLRRVGIDLVETDLSTLRSSNPAWSGLWYLFFQHVSNDPQQGWLVNPFGKQPVTIRSYLNLFNFKANHRKTLTVDTDEGWQSLVTSQNIHDGSSRHDNVALVVDGATAVDVLNTEQPVAKMSGTEIPTVLVGQQAIDQHLPQVQVLTEKAIFDATLKLIDSAQANDRIDLAMFYLSERHVIDALKQAKTRGVNLRVLLDPNKDAFGHEKTGIPNRQVASELHKVGVDIRWCDAHGEQCHSKMILKQHGTQSELILGSANFTARNLKNYNLETDLRVIGASDSAVFKDAEHYFDVEWSNGEGKQMSVDYKVYAEDSAIKYWTYRFMEWSGISTF